MPKSKDQPATQPQVETQAPAQTPIDAPLVNIPFEDVTVKVPEIDQHAVLLAHLAVVDQTRVEQPRMKNAFQGPTSFHDLPKAIAQEIYDAAESDNRGFDITRAIYAARDEQSSKPYTAPPLSPQQAEQTRLEMEAGRAAVQRHEALQAARPRPQYERTSTPVFRPDDYVPDQKKGQGHIPNMSARGQNLS